MATSENTSFKFTGFLGQLQGPILFLAYFTQYTYVGPKIKNLEETPYMGEKELFSFVWGQK